MRLPIRARLTAWYVVLLAAILAALGTFVATSLHRDLTDAVERSLRSAAGHIAAGYRTEGSKDFRDVGATVLPPDAGAQVLDPSGRVVVSAGAPIALRPMVGPRVRATVLSGTRARLTIPLGPRRDPYRVLASRIARGGEPGVLVAAQSLSGARAATDRVVGLLLVAGPVALLLTAAGGWWLARKALRPVERMAARAERIEIDRLDERLPAGTGDELGRLAATLNAMLDRLARGVEDRRRLIGDASHELRTPLAVMRAELDVTLDDDALDPAAREVLESAREEVARLTGIVDGLLTLARIDEGDLALERVRLDLRDVTAAVARGFAPLAAEHGVSIVADGEPALVNGDRDRLQRAISNLADNAVKASPPGRTVTLSAWAQDGRAGVRVRDEGSGVPEHARERIFDRFARLDEARDRLSGGSGLGLAICRELVEAHGGTVSVTSGADGSTFLISLPGTGAPAPARAGAGAARGRRPLRPPRLESWRVTSGDGSAIARIGVVLHPRRDVTGPIAALEGWSAAHGCGLLQIARVPDGPQVAPDGDAADTSLVVAIGGDGTVLAGLRAASASARPVMGVACGSLGALTTVSDTALVWALDAFAAGKWAAHRVPALRVADAAGATATAINDIAVVRAGGNQVSVEIEADGVLYGRFSGDGVIASTQVGSSAYGLAAGGPILAPGSDAWAITPLAPHGGCIPSLVLGRASRGRLAVTPGFAGARVEADGQPAALEPGALELGLQPDFGTLVRVGDEEAVLTGLRRRKVVMDSPRMLARDARLEQSRAAGGPVP